MESRHGSSIGVIAFGILVFCCWLGPEPAHAVDPSQVQASPSIGSAPSRPSLIRPHRKQPIATPPPPETAASTIQPQTNSLIKKPASDETTIERSSTKAARTEQRETGSGAVTTSPALPNSQAIKSTTGLTSSPSTGSPTGNSVGTNGTASRPSHSSRGVGEIMKRFPDIAPSIPTAPTPVPAPGQGPSLPNSPSPTGPPATAAVGSVTLTWQANREQDLAGYKIYIGTSSGSYTVAGSPLISGNSSAYTISNLPKGQTYFFAVSAYDTSGNESTLSSEVSKTLY